MAGDDLRKVSRGAPLRIPAAAYNSFLDAAADYRNRLMGQESDFLQRDTKTGIVYVRNKSGSDQDRFAVLGIAGTVITPEENEREFKSRIVFDVKKPNEVDEFHADHEMKYVILQEPLKNNAVGAGMVCGVTPVKLDVKDENDDYAGFKEGQTGFLETWYVGTARILWKEPGPGRKWGIVRFPVCDGPRLRVKNNSGETIPEGGAMRVTSADAERPFVFNVKKPDKDSQLNVIPLIGPPLAPGKERWLRFEPIMRFKLDDSYVDPGDFIGAKQGSWGLEKTKFGFLVLAVQESLRGTFAYVFFNGMTPVLKAMYDESGGCIDVKLATSGGGTEGETFPLDVIPDGAG